MAPHFETEKDGELIGLTGYVHTTDSESAENDHEAMKKWAKLHKIVIVEKPDPRGGVCADFPNRYEP
jgi:hypothetical protein